MGSLTDWIRANVRTVSRSEIIEKYRTRSAAIQRMTRARLSISHDDPQKPPSCTVAMQQFDGRWQERKGRIRFRMPTYDPRERYDIFVATTSLKYKGWTDSQKEMMGFLRVGPRGACFLFPSGDRITIAEPPIRWPIGDEGPPTHIRNLVVARGGFLTDQHIPNPAIPPHEKWLAEVSEVRAYLKAAADLAGDRIDPAAYHTDPKAICGVCGMHAAQDSNGDAAWRLCGARFYCQRCNESRGK